MNLHSCSLCDTASVILMSKCVCVCACAVSCTWKIGDVSPLAVAEPARSLDVQRSRRSLAPPEAESRNPSAAPRGQDRRSQCICPLFSTRRCGAEQVRASWRTHRRTLQPDAEGKNTPELRADRGGKTAFFFLVVISRETGFWQLANECCLHQSEWDAGQGWGSRSPPQCRLIGGVAEDKMRVLGTDWEDGKM